MPTLAVIADAEVQPSAIVSSSLMTRMRDNNAASFNAVFNREAGDFPLILFESGDIVGIGGVYTLTAISGFSGSYRFTLTLPGGGSGGGVVVKRNGVDVTPVYTASTTVDVSGWSRGDTIAIVSQSYITGSISADAPSGLGALTEANVPGGSV